MNRIVGFGLVMIAGTPVFADNGMHLHPHNAEGWIAALIAAAAVGALIALRPR